MMKEEIKEKYADVLEVAEKFLEEWSAGHHGRMGRYIQKSWLHGQGMKWKKILKTITARGDIEKYSIKKIHRVGDCCVDVIFTAELKTLTGKSKMFGFMRMLQEDAMGRPNKKGSWGVNPHSLLRSDFKEG